MDTQPSSDDPASTEKARDEPGHRPDADERLEEGALERLGGLRELGRSLAQALRYVAVWKGRRVLLKFGGAAMAAGRLGTLVDDLVLLQHAGVRPVLVHGGGPEISERLAQTGREARFIDGLRVTDEQAIGIVEEVLAGSANRRLVELLEAAGGSAAGIAGHGARPDEAIVHVEPHPRRELGLVGTVARIDPAPVERVLAAGRIPVVAPLGRGEDGRTYNVNADTVAAALAAALRAEKFLLLTDVPGIYRPLPGADDSAAGDGGDRALISELTSRGARRLISSGVVQAGMIPKVEACLAALDGGVPRAHVVGTGEPHSLLVELFTEDGIGTMITDRSR